MCLILLAWRVREGFPLVVAANRDEFFARATAPADFWPDAPQVLAGRDLEAGGTWLGITRQGRFAALTNFRDPARQRSSVPSRGHLVSRFLLDSRPAETTLDEVEAAAAGYNGFNLVLGDGERLWCYSNCGQGRHALKPGIYGLSNHLLDTPWPKVARGKSALAQALDALPDEQGLFDLLRDDTLAPERELPRTGVSPEWERLLSAAFVRMPGYGTRSSTVIVQGRSGAAFSERTWLASGEAGELRRYHFEIG